jgi:hypothetical protein
LNEFEPGLNWAGCLPVVGLVKMKMSKSIFIPLLFLVLPGFSQVRKLDADPAHWFMQKTDTKDNHHYETVYFRPGSSGTINAIQYMPEKGWEFNWWDYEKDKFQAKADIPMTGWFHARAVVQGRTLKVFLNNGKEPVMVRDDLDASLPSGSVGFWLGNCTSGAYRNLTIQPLGQ